MANRAGGAWLARMSWAAVAVAGGALPLSLAHAAAVVPPTSTNASNTPSASATPSAAVVEARKVEQAIATTIKKFVPAYVFIGGGSGVIISPDGLMVTNDHVAGESKHWIVRNGEKLYDADVLGTDPQGDITLLKIRNAKDMPFVEFADSDKIFVGQQVLAIGNPFATAEIIGEPTVTLGISSRPFTASRAPIPTPSRPTRRSIPETPAARC